jgi:hypothetical protein
MKRAILLPLLLLLVLPAVAAQDVTFDDVEMWEQPHALRCFANETLTGPIYTQVDNQGNRLEVFCIGGHKRLVFTGPNGKKYIAEGPYGFNILQKKVDGRLTLHNVTIVTRPQPAYPNETILDPQNITSYANQTRVWFDYTGKRQKKFYYRSLEMPKYGQGPSEREYKSLTWVYDVRTDALVRQDNDHQASWTDGTPTVTYLRPWGTPLLYKPAPITHEAISRNTPPSVTGEIGEFQRAYEFRTPVPITGTAADGRRITGTVTIPPDRSWANIEPFSAEEGVPFRFDVEYPGEDTGLVTYDLIEAPAGMTISARGIITWTPAAGQAGSHPVSVKTVYTGLTSDIDRFFLPVLPAAAAPPQPPPAAQPASQPWDLKTYLLIAAGAVIFILIITLIAMQKRHERHY